MRAHPASSSAAASLLDRLHGLIERTYELRSGVERPGCFVIGDEGLARIYGHREASGRDLSRPGSPMLLVRSTGDVHSVRIYYPDRLIANLERNPPSRGLGADNLRDFAAFVEELDHLLLLASAVRRGRATTGLELELHANVTKVLVSSLFLARTLGVERLDRHEQATLRFELLERGDYAAEEPWLRDRYRDARRHAVRFLERLRRTPRRERPRLLRRFSRSSLREKLALSA